MTSISTQEAGCAFPRCRGWPCWPRAIGLSPASPPPRDGSPLTPLNLGAADWTRTDRSWYSGCCVRPHVPTSVRKAEQMPPGPWEMLGLREVKARGVPPGSQHRRGQERSHQRLWGQAQGGPAQEAAQPWAQPVSKGASRAPATITMHAPSCSVPLGPRGSPSGSVSTATGWYFTASAWGGLSFGLDHQNTHPP